MPSLLISYMYDYFIHAEIYNLYFIYVVSTLVIQCLLNAISYISKYLAKLMQAFKLIIYLEIDALHIRSANSG